MLRLTFVKLPRHRYVDSLPELDLVTKDNGYLQDEMIVTSPTDLGSLLVAGLWRRNIRIWRTRCLLFCLQVQICVLLESN
jgi:hypothetical protein